MNPITLRFYGDVEPAYLEDYFHKSLKHVRVAVLAVLFLWALFGILDGWVVPEAKYKIWFIRYVLVTPFVIVLFFFTFTSYFKRFMQLTMGILTLVGGLSIIAMMVVAPPPGNYLYYAGLILTVMFAYTLTRLRFIYATLVSFTIVAAYEVSAIWISPTPLPILVNNTFFFLSANYMGMTGCYLLELYFRRDYIHDLLLEAERERSERLLLNILPQSIAAQLKDDHRNIAEGFDEATVIFADMAGFTKMSAQIPPGEVVTMLNEIFSAFDHLAEKHGVEKIKTIGDAYMGVGGLPIPRADHAEAVAEMALDMLDDVERFNAAHGTTLSVRIGINTGPVVAGVIGTKKFIYDLWGDTVNTASRMESRGVVDRIQVTEVTYESLRDKYEFERRGMIEVKGKGEMCTYFLTGRKPHTIANTALLASSGSSPSGL